MNTKAVITLILNENLLRNWPVMIIPLVVMNDRAGQRVTEKETCIAS
jgi:hypothetical protein